jgi:hypothetical protein
MSADTGKFDPSRDAAMEEIAVLMEGKDDGVWANTCGPFIRARKSSAAPAPVQQAAPSGLPFAEVVAEFATNKFETADDCRIALLGEVARLRAALAAAPAQPVGLSEQATPSGWTVWGVAQRADLADVTDGAGKIIATMHPTSARAVADAHNSAIAIMESMAGAA